MQVIFWSSWCMWTCVDGMVCKWAPIVTRLPTYTSHTHTHSLTILTILQSWPAVTEWPKGEWESYECWLTCWYWTPERRTGCSLVRPGISPYILSGWSRQPKKATHEHRRVLFKKQGGTSIGCKKIRVDSGWF